MQRTGGVRNLPRMLVAILAPAAAAGGNFQTVDIDSRRATSGTADIEEKDHKGLRRQAEREDTCKAVPGGARPGTRASTPRGGAKAAAHSSERTSKGHHHHLSSHCEVQGHQKDIKNHLSSHCEVQGHQNDIKNNLSSHFGVLTPLSRPLRGNVGPRQHFRLVAERALPDPRQERCLLRWQAPLRRRCWPPPSEMTRWKCRHGTASQRS